MEDCCTTIILWKRKQNLNNITHQQAEKEKVCIDSGLDIFSSLLQPSLPVPKHNQYMKEEPQIEQNMDTKSVNKPTKLKSSEIILIECTREFLTQSTRSQIVISKNKMNIINLTMKKTGKKLPKCNSKVSKRINIISSQKWFASILYWLFPIFLSSCSNVGLKTPL